MEARKDYKSIEIRGRKWRVTKFPAQTGCYIAYLMMEKFLPGGLEGQMSGADSLPKDRKPMSRQEFFELQNECLSVCFEELGSGLVPVKNENGTWRAIGLEFDTATVLGLTLQALMFNIVDFLEGSQLQGLMAGLGADLPQ